MCESDQPGKFVARVNVFLDDVKRKIVKPAAAPDRHREQHGGLPFGIIEKNQEGGGEADDKKQNAFQLDPKRIREVFHRGIVAPLLTGGNAESFAVNLTSDLPGAKNSAS